MPLFTDDDFLAGTVAGTSERIEEPQPDSREGFFAEYQAANFKDNTVFNGMKELFDEDVGDTPGDPNFQWRDHIEGYEEHTSKFMFARNLKDIAVIKTDIDWENHNNDILARAPTWSQITNILAANIIDPINLLGVPVITRLPKIASGIARAALGGAVTGLTVETGREALLHGMQQQRTRQETLMNTLGATAFGGILGGAIGALSNPAKIAGGEILSKAMQGEDFTIKVADDGTPSIERSAGAREALGDLEGEGLAFINEKLAKGLLGPEFLRPISFRGTTSPFVTLRRFSNKLFSPIYILKKQTKGHGS